MKKYLYVLFFSISILIFSSFVNINKVSAVSTEMYYSYSCLFDKLNNTYIHVRDITTDNEGNIYLTGIYGTFSYPGDNSFDFDCSEATDIKSAGISDTNIFLTKYNADGSYGWTHVIAGTSTALTSAESNSVTVGDNKVYITGYFRGTNIDFDDSSGTDIHSNVGIVDTYITVYSFNGDYITSKFLTGASSSEGKRLEIDSLGNVILSGKFNGTIDLDPSGSSVSETVSSQTYYIAKYDSSLSYVWHFLMPKVAINGISINLNDNIDIVGSLSTSDVDLNPNAGEDIYSTNGGQDAFLTSVTKDKEYIRSRVVGNTGYEYANDVISDSSGNIYFVGYADSSDIDFDGTSGTDNKSIPYGDGFVTKYLSNGNYVGTYLIRGQEDTETSFVDIDANDNVYISGIYYNDNVDVDGTSSGTNFNTVGDDDYDVFITKYDSSFSWVWSKQIGGDGSDYVKSMNIKKGNSLLIVVESQSSTSVNVSNDETLNTNSDDQYLFTKYVIDTEVGQTTVETIDDIDTTPTITGEVTEDLGTISSVVIQVDSTTGIWIECTANDGNFDEVTESFTCQITDELSSSEHIIYIKVEDSNNNEDIIELPFSLVVEEENENSTKNLINNLITTPYQTLVSNDTEDNETTVEENVVTNENNLNENNSDIFENNLKILENKPIKINYSIISLLILLIIILYIVLKKYQQDKLAKKRR